MTAIIQTEKLTKSYGEHRGIIDIDLEVDRGRGVRLPRPERRRQDDDHPDACSTTSARPSGRALIFGIDTTVDPIAIHRRIGYLPGRVRPLRQADRRPDDRVLREPPRRRRRGLPGISSIERLDLDPSREVQASTRRATSRRSASSSPSSTGPICSSSTSRRRASTRSSSRRSTRSSARRRPRARTVFLSSHILVRGREDLRPGRRSSATAVWSRSTASRRCATSPTTRSSCGSPATCRQRPSRRCRASATSRPTTTSCGCASRARSRRSSGRPPSYELARLRESRAVARGDLPRRSTAAGPGEAA